MCGLYFELKQPAGSKVQGRVVKVHLLHSIESSHLLYIYILSQHKVDTYWQVKFVLSTYIFSKIQTPSIHTEMLEGTSVIPIS